MLPLPLVAGGVLGLRCTPEVLGLLRIPDVSELLAPEPELMLLEPELERWRSRQSLNACPLSPVHEVVEEPELERCSRSRQLCSAVPVMPRHALGMACDVPDEDLFGEL